MTIHTLIYLRAIELWLFFVIGAMALDIITTPDIKSHTWFACIVALSGCTGGLTGILFDVYERFYPTGNQEELNDGTIND